MEATVEEAPRAMAAATLDEFYRATYGRLLGVVAAVGGDVSLAEEAVQDAFVRLVPRWDWIRRYDDPELWVRHVALNRLSSSRRKIRNGRKAVERLRASDETSSPDASGTVHVQMALNELALPQRSVLVMSRLGFSTREIAQTLDIAEGTVKSRLSRARQELNERLRQER